MTIDDRIYCQRVHQAQVRLAAAQIAVAEQNLQTLIVNRASLEGDVASAQAALELAEIDLANTRITATANATLDCAAGKYVVTVKNNLLLAQIDLYHRALGGGWSENATSSPE